MGVWYCDVCDSIMPDHRCYTGNCHNNLCNGCFSTYVKNLRNYITNEELENSIPEVFWHDEYTDDHGYYRNSYLCKECVKLKIQKRKEILEF